MVIPFVPSSAAENTTAPDVILIDDTTPPLIVKVESVVRIPPVVRVLQ